MTYQTSEPIHEMAIAISARPLGDLVHQLEAGTMTYDLPYQRGDVWTVDQRIMLIYSVLSSTPIPALIINDRPTDMWFGPNGEELPVYAVIDGKQRLTTFQMFMASELLVPASWFPAEDVLATKDTPDGPYVRYSGLARRQGRFFENKAIPVAEAHVKTVAEEAAIYGRVNGAGSPQTREDMDRAARVAGSAR